MRVHVDSYATDGPGDVAGLERILSGLPTGDIARLALAASIQSLSSLGSALSAKYRTS